MLLDDQENRSRQNNIRIPGVPESVEAPNVTDLARSIFNQIMNKPKDNHIEIDRAHSALGPNSSDSAHPRDIITRIHSYTSKATIMQAARKSKEILFNDKPIQLLADLSKHTLQLPY